MSWERPYPPFEVTSLEPAQHSGSPGVRIDVALSPEDYDQVERVAVHLVERYARTYYTVWLFFQPTSELARQQMAPLRARYVRDDIPEHPGPMRSNQGRQSVDIRLTHGVLTVEKAGEAS